MATSRGRAGEARVGFDALSIKGGLLGSEWLGKVAALQAAAQEPSDYRVPKGLQVRDEIARSWRIAQARFQEMESGRASGGKARALTERFLEAVLRDAFGFGSLVRANPMLGGERMHPVTFFGLGDRVPVVAAPAGAGLDTSLPELGDDQRQRSAFGLLQETLNASDAALWGLAADGLSLRIARDNASFTAAGMDRGRPRQDLHGGAVPGIRDAMAPRPRVALRAHRRPARGLSAGGVAGCQPSRGDARAGQAERRIPAGARGPGAGLPVTRGERSAPVRFAYGGTHQGALLRAAPAARLSARLPANGRGT